MMRPYVAFGTLRPMPRLLLATNNAGKVAEYDVLLEGCGWEVVTPRDLGIDARGRGDRRDVRGECYNEGPAWG